MGKPIVTAFSTLDNVAEGPHLWSGQFFSDATGAFNDEVLAEADSVLSGTLEHADWKPYLRTEPGTPCGSSNSGCLRAECSHCG